MKINPVIKVSIVTDSTSLIIVFNSFLFDIDLLEFLWTNSTMREIKEQIKVSN